MSAVGWQQVDKLFQAVVELGVTERALFLDQACDGDQTLRDKVESLLSSDALEWDFIESPAIESAAVLLADDEPRLAAGEQIGHYEIVRLIGKGGMGEVYCSIDRTLSREVALKLLPFDYTQNADRLRRFRREAQTVSALNHPNILTIHELVDIDGQQFIATELVEGETLRKRIMHGQLSVKDALEVGIQIASALAAAHQTGIIHRDIKPENIMLRPDGYVKVLDFGLAKLAEIAESDVRVKSNEPTDISSTFLIGTPKYMSPEQINGLTVDARSDIFSLGVVLYEMVSGCAPFDEKEPGKLAKSILENDPPVLKNYLDAVPEKLDAAVAKMLCKDRDNRYQNANDLLLDLKLIKDEIHSGAGVSQIRRAFTATGVLILLACAAAFGYMTYKSFNSTNASVPTAPSQNESGTWATKASISSPRLQAEPAVLNGRLYVAGGWNVCTPFANLEVYDSQNDTWTQSAPMLTGRGRHGVATLDGRLYAVGGSTDCGNVIDSVEAYDPASDTWTPKTPLPLGRLGHVVAASNNKLYAIGGRSADGNFLNLNSQYDLDTDKWTERAPMPTAREGAAVAVVDGIIYVIGGQAKDRNVATVEAYDPLTDSWKSRQPMTLTRKEHAATEFDGKIYVFGGRGNRPGVEAYDPATDTWADIGKMPSLRSSVHAAAFEGSIYLAGGYDGVDYLSSVIAFTPQPNSAQRAAKCPTLETKPITPMPTSRGGMTVGVIGGIIYVVGGYQGNWKFLADNEAYDPVANSWTRKAAMPITRETRATSTAVVGEKLYVIGGNAAGRCTNANHAYDPKTDTWSTLAPMPTARCHVAVIAHNGLIYAIGGADTNGSIRYANVEIYDPATDVWTAATPMPAGRQDVGAVSLNGIIYAVGGWNPALNPDALNIVEAYDPIMGTWTTKSRMPTARMGMGVGVMNGLLVVVGGVSNEKTLSTAEAYDPELDAWQTLTGNMKPRSFFSAVTIDDAFYEFGGRVSDEAVDDFVSTGEIFTLKPCASLTTN